jgi:lysozyme family protein
MNFEQAIGYVLAEEGGFTAKESDTGNWTGGKIGKGVLKGTKYGISAASYPDEDIRNLTKERAKLLFKRDFWDKIKGDQLPVLICLHVLDFAVNAGVPVAIRELQRAAGVTVDGLIGPKTLKAAASVTPWKYSEMRIWHYTSLAKKKAAYREFLAGWLLRNQKITRVCLES